MIETVVGIYGGGGVDYSKRESLCLFYSPVIAHHRIATLRGVGDDYIVAQEPVGTECRLFKERLRDGVALIHISFFHGSEHFVAAVLGTQYGAGEWLTTVGLHCPGVNLIAL